MQCIWNQISGICPGDKVVKSSEDPSSCVCPAETVEGFNDKCFECAEGEVANDNQTGCVGMSDWTFFNTGLQTLYTRP